MVGTDAVLRGRAVRDSPVAWPLIRPVLNPNLFGTVLVEDVGDTVLIRWLFGSYRQDDVFGCAIETDHGFDHVNACGCGAANQSGSRNCGHGRASARNGDSSRSKRLDRPSQTGAERARLLLVCLGKVVLRYFRNGDPTASVDVAFKDGGHIRVVKSGFHERRQCVIEVRSIDEYSINFPHGCGFR